MKRSQLFIGVLVTSVVMILSDAVAKPFSAHHSVLKKSQGVTMRVYSLPESRVPLNNSQEKNHYRATPSFCNQSSAYSIRINHQGNCFSKALFSDMVEIFRLPKPSSFDDFFMTLFRVIIATNAP